MKCDQEDTLLESAFAAYEEGRFVEAEVRARRAAAEGEDAQLALHLVALSAAQTGRRAVAIETLRNLLAAEPDSCVILSDLGCLLRMEGKLDEAITCLERACHVDPTSAPALNNLGEVYLAADRFEDARLAFQEAAELAPDLAAPMHNLGIALQAQGRESEAVIAYRQAIARAPRIADSYAQLGQLLDTMGGRDEAMGLFRRAAELQPAGTPGRIAKAMVLFKQGHAESAEAILRDVLRNEPENVDALCRLGDILTRVGRFAESTACFSRALAQDPCRAEAYAGMVGAKTMSSADRPLIEMMTTQLRGGPLSVRARASLHFSIAKALDDLGDYAAAIRHYDEGNRVERGRLRGIGRAFDPAEHEAAVAQSIATFTPDFFARNTQFGSPNEFPVLVVGMPRSGTTLVAQILSSHPHVGAGDELTFWGDESAALMDRTLTPVDARRLARHYIEAFGRMSPDKSRGVDKMPQNFLHLGLVHLVLPRARIIHCRRNPIDTCLSIYFTHFGLLQDFAFDRDSIVFYYRQYLKLMAHWRAVLPPAQFLEIDYEDLIAEREPMTRKLVAFCGLGWDDRCLSPEHNDRIITTASMRQARLPVYGSSVERWRHYEPWLGAFASLAPTTADAAAHVLAAR